MVNMIEFLCWWCWKVDFVCVYICLSLCVFECYSVCVCAVTRAYIYMYICAYNCMHLNIYTHISAVCSWEVVSQRKRMWEKKSGWGVGGKKNCFNQNNFFFLLILSYLIAKGLLEVNMKYLFHDEFFECWWWLKLKSSSYYFFK